MIKNYKAHEETLNPKREIAQEKPNHTIQELETIYTEH